MIKKNIHIENSFNEWLTSNMRSLIHIKCFDRYQSFDVDKVLNRSYRVMYIEWYLHNTGYWLTLPFKKNPRIVVLNERFKHLNLEEHLENENP